LLFIGRADDQVKIRGYRVEPGEVEQSLRRYPELQDAVVLADGEGDDRRLVAFVVLGDTVNVKELRARAVRDLPDYMVPSRIVILGEIPFTQHGKRDVAALRAELARYNVRVEGVVAPITETERYLAALWEDLLNIEQVGRQDDFFALGGHSLLAFRMSRRIGRELDVQLSFNAILDNTVLKDLAGEIDAARTAGAVS
jgi:phenylacetate-coenzyme A ligase PaaK-like adenylate-forming protein